MDLKRRATLGAALYRSQRVFQQAQEALQEMGVDERSWDALGRQGCAELDAGLRAALAALEQGLSRARTKAALPSEAGRLLDPIITAVSTARQLWTEYFAQPMQERFRGR